jgi:hypothetical protein
MVTTMENDRLFTVTVIALGLASMAMSVALLFWK